jgi:nitroreductase
MDFFKLVEARFSAMSYLPKKIAQADLDRILATTFKAPSAGNLQAYKIAVITDKAKREDLAGACAQEPPAQSPVSLIFLADLECSAKKYRDRGARLYAIQDATIAAAYCQLAATELGIGSLWIGNFDSKEAMRLANAGEYEIPVAVITLGYTKEKPGKKERRKPDEILK